VNDGGFVECLHDKSARFRVFLLGLRIDLMQRACQIGCPAHGISQSADFPGKTAGDDCAGGSRPCASLQVAGQLVLQSRPEGKRQELMSTHVAVDDLVAQFRREFILFRSDGIR
jgi:hypothetical protein